MVIIDRVTRQRIPTQQNIGDIVYPAKTVDNDVRQRESEVVIGPWKDYTGSGGPTTKQQLMFAGTANQLFGTEAALGGAKVPPLNEVGQNSEIYRRRNREVYKELNGKEVHI